MSAQLSMALMQRAVEIADSCMRSDIECHCVHIGGVLTGRYGLVDENCVEVRTLAASDPAIREAFDYLRARGLAELNTDDHGEVIQLLTENFRDEGERA